MSSRGRLRFIGGTVNGETYGATLSEELIPTTERLYPNENFNFQQNDAFCRTTKLTNA